MISISDIIISYHQAKAVLSPDVLVILLGPTASGKTKLAVELARHINGEIISADSRQVYRGMDIGTGKDLSEYQEIAYHGIDIVDPGEKYNVDRFKEDFFETYDSIIARGKQPILCGGTGSYIQSILQQHPYSSIPKSETTQQNYAHLDKEELLLQIHRIGLPDDYNLDRHSHKRLLRALEIVHYLQDNDITIPTQRTITNYVAFGLNPSVELRRQRITNRLKQRIQEGLIDEVQKLLINGVDKNTLVYYGLEYKYTCMYLDGEMSYDHYFDKLNTEIHRYAKRQMTYFRKMEKDNISIQWL